MSTNHRKYISGCYVGWSARLQAIFDRQFPNSDRLVVKIGCSHDLLSRIETLTGVENRLSRGRFAVDRAGYGHVGDWELWMFEEVLGERERFAEEKAIQDKHSRLAGWLWPIWHREVSDRRYLPKSIEIFIAREDVLARSFGNRSFSMADLRGGRSRKAA